MHLARYRVRHGDRKALSRVAPADTSHFASKDAASAHVQKGIERLDALQQLVWAQVRYALLLIFQGMDGAGKDHVIKHVMSGVNPQGTDVHSFKQPSAAGLDHDYLGLAAQRLPPDRIGRDIWKHRFEDINAFERHLWRNGTIVRKFFLHVSRREQQRRLLARLDDPAKNWKFSAGDLVERDKWREYQAAYAEAIAATSTPHAPWYVVPADHKWFSSVVVADAIVEALEELDLSFPKPTPTQRRELRAARQRLLRET